MVILSPKKGSSVFWNLAKAPAKAEGFNGLPVLALALLKVHQFQAFLLDERVDGFDKGLGPGDGCLVVAKQWPK